MSHVRYRQRNKNLRTKQNSVAQTNGIGHWAGDNIFFCLVLGIFDNLVNVSRAYFVFFSLLLLVGSNIKQNEHFVSLVIITLTLFLERVNVSYVFSV